MAERRKRSPVGTVHNNPQAPDIVTRLRDMTDMSWEGDEITDPLAEEAADEIESLRADRDRWRSIADSFAEAGTHPTAHYLAFDDYEKACRG